jgi:GNAT superfamily N-acetyltransferase
MTRCPRRGLRAVPEVIFARESISQVIGEIKPLLEAHWQEIAQYPDIPLDPDYDQYAHAEAAGQLRIYTARADRLVGYAIYIVAPAWHYRQSLQARQDILFLLPKYRRGRTGLKLIQFTEQQLQAEGVQVVYQQFKAWLDFSSLLKQHQLTGSVYARRLN